MVYTPIAQASINALEYTEVFMLTGKFKKHTPNYKQKSRKSDGKMKKIVCHTYFNSIFLVVSPFYESEIKRVLPYTV